ncbi:hypothetical protein OVA07_06410 [Novosphingobium sp. SL115]|uniref:hypothetical protein n=1 Tax=Novosphingobium sp. SL115 TaxID=2995150 RepID=UPI002272416C|nr:hypothetical protein [Novosphingobium sp. SL115]MCY1670644.1 hypothetical protein [Novosphingobium sp. SL115]
MKFSRIASALVAASLAAAPIAAEAATRATDSQVYSTSGYSANRASEAVDADHDLFAFIWVIIIIAGGVITYTITQVVDNGSNGAN